MTLLRWLARALRWGIFAFLATFAAVALHAALRPAIADAEMSETDVIIVLGAGMDADGTLHRSTIRRVERGIALWQAGVAPRLHMTGGMAVADGPSAGDGMAAFAMANGVPAAAITIEGASLSTLQNALLSQPILGPTDSAVIVTEAFHLPRAWASFHWADMAENDGPDALHLAMSTRFREDADRPVRAAFRLVLRETAAIWFNLGRVIAYHVGGWLGVAEERRMAWLI